MHSSHEQSVAEHGEDHAPPETVEMPNSTGAPLVMAFGLVIAASSVVMHLAFAVVGVVIAVCGLAAWLRQLAPGAGIHFQPLVPESLRPQAIQAVTGEVLTIKPGMPGHRLRVPEEIYPYSAGIKGGLVAGAMMAATALLYGVVSGHGIWYPVNLLAAMVLPGMAQMTDAQLDQFHMSALILGTVIHLVTSTIVGLFFGVILPMCPRWPLLWGGLVAPLLWSGFVYGFMGVLNPVMNDRVNWRWFFLSQFVFGLTLGFVVMRTERVRIKQVLAELKEVSPGLQPDSETNES